MSKKIKEAMQKAVEETTEETPLTSRMKILLARKTNLQRKNKVKHPRHLKSNLSEKKDT
ncbi:hypothetical protein N8464_00815 [bacterium]|nr:hypothetical protein [bacterium]